MVDHGGSEDRGQPSGVTWLAWKLWERGKAASGREVHGKVHWTFDPAVPTFWPRKFGLHVTSSPALCSNRPQRFIRGSGVVTYKPWGGLSL